jgi:voltage-gated potassium channel
MIGGPTSGAGGLIDVVRRLLRIPFRPLLELPIVRRLGFHARRIGAGLDVRFFRRLTVALLGIVLVAALVVSVIEDDKRSVAGVGDSF